MTAGREDTSAFALPERLRAKADPALIADDERAFARVGAALDREIDGAGARLARVQREQARSGQQALDRDLEVQRLATRQRVLRRFGVDACIGRVVASDGTTVYIGRFGLADADGSRLLVDWRAPAAEPFFAASHAQPMGLSSRRRYRWSNGRVVDYWDEGFAPDGVDHSAALDDQSAFIASLGASRTSRMRDVLATIQADQDAIVRAGSSGALVVEGGPGTGKTAETIHSRPRSSSTPTASTTTRGRRAPCSTPTTTCAPRSHASGRFSTRRRCSGGCGHLPTCWRRARRG